MKEKLITYKAKRKFSETPEPAESEGSKGQRLYVVQKHDASHLHYDFRLEHHGVLMSWAVPKGPSIDPAVKRLAVHVEDHPVSYGGFAGVIPKGNYGAGTVEIWDTGSWEPIGNVDEMMREGVLKFEVFGKKLKGKWALIRLKHDEKNWLLIKEKDEAWNERPEILGSRLPVVSKLDMHQFRPQLAMRATSAPLSDEWLHEIKYDGYRIVAWKQKGDVYLISRNGLDWTKKFPDIAKAIKDNVPDETTIDGEMVVLSREGISDFGGLQKWLKDGSGSDPQFVCFDLIVEGGSDLTGLPLGYRKEKLEALLTKLPEASRYWLRYSTHVVGHGESMMNEACRNGLEGIISKKVNSKYFLGRTSSWVKSKCYQQDEFVIGGYTKPGESRVGFGSLLLGQFNSEGKFQYAGKVGSGFDDDKLNELKKKMDRLKVSENPFEELGSNPGAEVWVSPQLIAQIRYAERTKTGSIRHGVFLGLREDKFAKEVTGEKAMNELPIEISHPDRILFPLLGITKLNLAEYYDRMADRILPYIHNRPLSIVRCPDGSEHACFFQKHRGPGMPESVEKKVRGEKEPLLIAATSKDLLTFVQFGGIEFHAWGSTFEDIDEPDMMVFDLDPGPGISWKRTIEAAEVLREFLSSFGMQSFAKISGGKGIHAVVPIIRGELKWPQFKELAHAISTSLDSLVPGQFVTVASKQKREKKIFIDYLRNARGATSVVPYTVRANEDASVTIPISWDTLRGVKSARQFTVQNIDEWLVPPNEDPWKDFFKSANRISPDIWEKVGLTIPRQTM